MKLTLPIPIRKVALSTNTYTFESEDRLVNVIAVSRTRAGAGRWHYTAHYEHPDTHPEACRTGINGSLACWIRRASYPKWKPPVFSSNESETVMIDLKSDAA